MSRNSYLEKVAAMHGVRPMARPLMCSPFWWLLLAIQAVFAVPLAIIVNINILDMWRDYRDSIHSITSTRRAIVRAKQEQQ